MLELRVMSLFDGIACGYEALKKVGIKVVVYYASEIDKYAIKIANKNHPDIIELGDINNIDFTQFIGKIDLIMGGSPCQDLSIAGKRKGLTGERSGLFYKFVEAIETIKPKYFLLENNVGMPQEAYEEISRLMGCYPIEINSALVSAQTRKRFYWTNIGPQQYNLFGFPTVDIPQPKNKGILLKDILESGQPYQEKSYCLTVRYQGATFPHDYLRNQRTQVAEPICINIPENVTVRKHEVDIQRLKITLKKYRNLSIKRIAEMLNRPLTQVEHWFRMDNCFSIPDADIWFELKKLLGIETDEFDAAITEFETKEGNYEKSTRKYYVDGKMSTLMAAGNDEILEPIRIGHFNKGEQGQRIYSSNGKSIACASGEGGGTQIWTEIPLEPKQLGHISNTNAQANRVYSVHNKSVTLKANGGGGGAKTGLYKIDLPDGEYLIRKLTPLECERLQTLPDNYTEGISATQRYKCIGNGWTVDVIAHIFSFIGGANEG